VAGGGEPCHVQADLRDDVPGQFPADAGDLREPVRGGRHGSAVTGPGGVGAPGGLDGVQEGPDRVVEPGDLAVQEGDVVHVVLGDLGVVAAEHARQGPLQLLLVLLKRLGLRINEVAAMQLGDIYWWARQLTVRGKGSRLDQLPLPADAGQAIDAWLRGGRPGCSCRPVFTTLPARSAR
jgi:hypothetical protein